MKAFLNISLPTLIGIALFVLFQACKESKQEAIPCPTCYDLRSKCIEGVCQCEEGTHQVNQSNWCVGPGQFMASFDDWFCLDTLALTVGSDIYFQPSGQRLSRWATKNDPNASNWSTMNIVNEPGKHYIVFGGFIPTTVGSGPSGMCDTLRRRYFLDFYGELVHPDTIIGHFIARTVDYVEGEGMRRDTLVVPMYMLK
ncbi:MAG: hypothetical protein SFV52_07615 [Saprospiraceae bacterium]|nr:hypothetical protein [Saprospiraceae bacterium]